MNNLTMRYWISFSTILLACTSYALNPIAEWGHVTPQQLITRDSETTSTTTPTAEKEPLLPEPTIIPTLEQDPSTHYEDILSLTYRGIVAAFHVDPSSFIEDHNRLKNYFAPQALDQVEKILFTGNGSGILDPCIISQSSCDAMPTAMPNIEKPEPNLWIIKLPLILNDEQKFDSIIQINPSQQPLKISSFKLEPIK